MGAAAALAGLAGELPGRILSVGTPAEEGGGGKVKLVEAGAFDDVDAAMMVHPSQRNLVYRKSLGRIKLFMDFRGKPSHASAAPDKGVNALDALISAYQNIGLLRQQLPPTTPSTASSPTAGGPPTSSPSSPRRSFTSARRTANSSPSFCTGCRPARREPLGRTGQRSSSGRTRFRYEPMKYNPELVSLFEANLRTLGVEPEPVDPVNTRDSGSTDMGNLSWKVPAIHPYLQLVPANIANHTHEFAEASGGEPGKNMLRLGATAMAITAIDLLTAPGKMAAVKKCFEEGD